MRASRLMSRAQTPTAWQVLRLESGGVVAPSDIALGATLCGGQCFRWRAIGGGKSYLGVVQGRVIEVGFREFSPNVTSASRSRRIPATMSALHFRLWNASSLPQRATDDAPRFLIHYLALHRNLTQLWNEEWTRFPEHPLVQKLMKNQPPYIRVLQQDVHETIFAFICSQNNHLKRITSLVESLATEYGQPLARLTEDPVSGELVAAEGAAITASRKRSRDADGTPQQHTIHAFPTISELQSIDEERLRSLGFGYRSKFLVKTVQQIQAFQNSSGHSFYDALSLPASTVHSQRQQLMTLHGVGRKVADCILLFSLGARSVVPIDTHMAQISVECLLQSKAAISILKRCAQPSKVSKACQVHLKTLDNLRVKCRSDHAGKKTESSESAVAKVLIGPAHHEALQWAYQSLFGDECGWAHSILFTDRALS